MSAPRRGGRERGRGRADGRVGASRNMSANTSEEVIAARMNGRGRGRGNLNLDNGVTRGINMTLQKANNTSRNGTRSSTNDASTSRSYESGASNGITTHKLPVTGSVEERYNKLRARRPAEVKEAERLGYVVDPEKPRALADAVTPIGTCPDMCPELERVTRLVQKDEWGAEKDVETRSRMVESRMVKKFRRSAAGSDEQLPSDLRPASVLLTTVKYLFGDLINEYGSLGPLHNFLWDRTRAIRNDFSIQQLTKTADLRIQIECYEHIARFHILSLHQVGGLPAGHPDRKNYTWQHDFEQLDKTLLSLFHLYDVVRERYRSKNEPEFRAYAIILHIRDPSPDLEDQVQTWPKEIYSHERVRTALTIYAAACSLADGRGPMAPFIPSPVAQANWNRFWKLVGSKQVPYLMACVAEIHFNSVRKNILHSIWKNHQRQYRLHAATRGSESWTLEYLGSVLYFEEEEDTQSFVEFYNFHVAETTDGTPYLDLTSVTPEMAASQEIWDKVIRGQTFTYDPVEKKRYFRSLPAIISGLSVKEARSAGLIVEETDSDRPVQKEKEETLFVGQSDDEEDVAVKVPKPSSLNPSRGNFNMGIETAAASASVKSSGGFGQPSTTPSNVAMDKSQPANPFAPQKPSAQAKASNPFAPPPSSTAPLTSSGFGAPTPASQSNGFSGFGTHITAMQETSKSSPFAPTTPGGTSGSLFTLGSTSSAPLVTTDQKAGNSFGFKLNPPASSVPVSSSGASLSSPTSSTLKAPTPSGFNFTPAPELASKSQPSSFGKPPSGFSFPSSTPATDVSKSALAPQLPKIHLTPPQEDSQTPPQPASASNIPQYSLPSFSVPTNLIPSADLQSSFTKSVQPPKAASSFPSTKLPSFSSSNGSYGSSTAAVGQTTTTSLPTQDSTASSATLPTFALPPTQTLSQCTTNIDGSTASPFFPTRPLPPVSSPSQATNTPYKPPNEEARKKQALDFVARQLFLDPNLGYLNQYIEHVSGPIIRQAFKDLEVSRIQAQADEFRAGKLAQRYGVLWRYKITEKRLRRQRIEGKERMRAAAEAHRRKERDTSVRRESGEMIVEQLSSFKKSQNDKWRATRIMETSYGTIGQPQQDQQTPVLTVSKPQNGVGAKEEFHKPRQSVRAHKRSRTQPNMLAASNPNNAGYRVSKPFKVRSPSPSMLTAVERDAVFSSSGLSFTGASVHDVLGVPFGTKLSTMKSNYFALKAMGITLPPSSAGSSLVSERTGRKRARDSEGGLDPVLTSESPPERKRRTTPPARLSLSSPVQNGASQQRFSGSESPVDLSASSQTRNVHPDDEALFARMRKVMSALDESSAFYREEIQKDELRRSQTSASPSGSSPPSNLPKYYSRTSKFVPRESYGKRPEPKRIVTPLVDKGKIKAMGQVNGFTNGFAQSSAFTPVRQQPARLQRSQSKNSPKSGGAGQHSGASADDAIEL